VSLTRRDFLQAGTTALLAATPSWLVASPPGRKPNNGGVPTLTDPDTQELAHLAVQAARSAGAEYADVRLTHVFDRAMTHRWGVNDAEEMGVGVRALFNGYWGFASGPTWTPQEVRRLGHEAVSVAKVNATGERRIVDLAPVPANETGHWESPQRIDPFSVPVDEILDFLGGVAVYIQENNPGVVPLVVSTRFSRREQAFASTEGAYFTQALTTTAGGLAIELEKYPPGEENRASSDLLLTAARGWEYLRDNDGALRAEAPRLRAQLEADWRLPWKPVDVGRYELIVDAVGMARLVDGTLGAATELDRALGYEANASGTSYLDDPIAMLGTLQVASPLVTLTANRSAPAALGTVRWDDEGVRPDDFTLVKDGILADYQTTREAAGWLKAAYMKRGMPVRSHGCASGQTALFGPMLFPPNLRLEPGARSVGLDELIADLDRGVYVRGLSVSLDFQQRDGWSVDPSLFYEVKGGKTVARLVHAGLLFRTTELWKALTALGGPKSLRSIPAMRTKGEPAQTAIYSVGAVPARFKQQTIIDNWRKA
jgi:TldD protein